MELEWIAARSNPHIALRVNDIDEVYVCESVQHPGRWAYRSISGSWQYVDTEEEAKAMAVALVRLQS